MGITYTQSVRVHPLTTLVICTEEETRDAKAAIAPTHQGKNVRYPSSEVKKYQYSIALIH